MSGDKMEMLVCFHERDSRQPQFAYRLAVFSAPTSGKTIIAVQNLCASETGKACTSGLKTVNAADASSALVGIVQALTAHHSSLLVKSSIRVTPQLLPFHPAPVSLAGHHDHMLKSEPVAQWRQIETRAIASADVGHNHPRA